MASSISTTRSSGFMAPSSVHNNISNATPSRNLSAYFEHRATSTLQQLNTQYASDANTKELVKKIKAAGEALKGEDNTAIFEAFNSLSKAIKNFETDSQKASLLYPLRITLTQIAPQNTKEQEGLRAFQFTGDQGRPNQAYITPENRAQTIATSTYLLHFYSFVIQKDTFCWQDKMQAIYHAQKNDLVLTQPVTLATEIIDFEEKTWIISDEDSKLEHSGHEWINLAYLEYYYWMIHHGATKAALLKPLQSFDQNPEWSAFIELLCRYSNLQTKQLVDPSQRDAEELAILKEKIQAHNLTAEHLLNTFENQYIESYLLDAFQPVPLPQSTSPKPNKLVCLLNDQTPLAEAYQAVCNQNTKFKEYMDSIGGPEAFFEKGLIAAHEPLQVLQLLSSEDILDFLLLHRSFIGGSISNSIYIKQSCDIEGLKLILTRQKELKSQTVAASSEDLWDFVEKVNNDPLTSSHIVFTESEKSKIDLSEEMQVFQNTLRENSLAKEVLQIQHGCKTLIHTLDQHGELTTLLEAKDIKGIKERAKLINRNANTDLILHLIEGGLPASKALTLSDSERNNWRNWYDTLFSTVNVNYGITETDKCKGYTLKRVSPILETGDTHAVHLNKMSQDLEYFQGKIFSGLVQCDVLFPDEIFSLPSRNITQLNHNNDLLIKEGGPRIRENGLNNPIELIANIPELKDQRNALNELREKYNKDTTNKEYEKLLYSYVEHIIQHLAPLYNNLTGIYATVLNELVKAGMPFSQVMQSSTKDKEQLKNDFDSFAEKFLTTKRILTEHFKEVKIQEIPAFLKKIVHHNPGIKPTQLLEKADAIVHTYCRNNIIQKYFEDGIIKPKHLFTLNDSEYEVICKAAAMVREVGKKYPYYASYAQECLREMSVLHRSKDDTTFAKDMKDIADYLSSKLLRRIIQKQDLSAKAFVTEVRTAGVSFDWEIYFDAEQLQRERLRKLSQSSAEIADWFSTDRSASEYLATLYEEDTIKGDFSINQVVAKNDQYLDNLEEYFRQYYSQMGLSLQLISYSTKEQQEELESLYNRINYYLYNYQRYQPLNNIHSALSSLMTQCKSNRDSLEAIIQKLRSIDTILGSPDSQYFVSPKFTCPLEEIGKLHDVVENIKKRLVNKDDKEAITRRMTRVLRGYEADELPAILSTFASPLMNALLDRLEWDYEEIFKQVSDIARFNGAVATNPVKSNNVINTSLEKHGYENLESLLVARLRSPKKLYEHLVYCTNKLLQPESCALLDKGANPLTVLKLHSDDLHMHYQQLTEYAADDTKGIDAFIKNLESKSKARGHRHHSSRADETPNEEQEQHRHRDPERHHRRRRRKDAPPSAKVSVPEIEKPRKHRKERAPEPRTRGIFSGFFR